MRRSFAARLRAGADAAVRDAACGSIGDGAARQRVRANEEQAGGWGELRAHHVVAPLARPAALVELGVPLVAHPVLPALHPRDAICSSPRRDPFVSKQGDAVSNFAMTEEFSNGQEAVQRIQHVDRIACAQGQPAVFAHGDSSQLCVQLRQTLVYEPVMAFMVHSAAEVRWLVDVEHYARQRLCSCKRQRLVVDDARVAFDPNHVHESDERCEKERFCSMRAVERCIALSGCVRLRGWLEHAHAGDGRRWRWEWWRRRWYHGIDKEQEEEE